LNVTVSKTYDGSPVFGREFQLSGMAQGDAAPVISGTASVGNSTAGSYSNFAASSLALGNANYTLTGGAVSATISPESPKIQVVNTVPTVPEIKTNAPGLTLPEKPQPTDVHSDAPVATAAATETPSPVTGGDVSQAPVSKQESIVVSLVQEPSLQAEGIVNVMVPTEMVSRNGGFSFPLPEKISAGSSVLLSVTKVGGDPLPSWLQFDPQTKTFTATNVPIGGLPLRVIVSNSGTQTTIIISEN
jgi:hypothetical protein